MILLYLNCTANLGDFLNVLPVLSGLSKQYEISFIIKSEMKKFYGISDLLEYQGIFKNVYFDDDPVVQNTPVFLISSWTREDRINDYTPIESCRYAHWLSDNHGFKFDIDDDFILQVPDLPMEVEDKVYAGDRWFGPQIDDRRNSGVLSKFDKLEFIDFNRHMVANVYIIKNSKKPFISTFTGISVLADLLNVDQYVLWGDDIRNWDNKPIEYSFAKHFYGNRKSKLMYINDFERDIYDKLYSI